MSPTKKSSFCQAALERKFALSLPCTRYPSSSHRATTPEPQGGLPFPEILNFNFLWPLVAIGHINVVSVNQKQLITIVCTLMEATYSTAVNTDIIISDIK